MEAITREATQEQRILISGAGIAGPALAHALAGQGYDITIVERAPALRDGGQAVDFRGPVHRDVLERLDLWRPICERRTRGLNLVLLRRDGAPAATLPSVMISGDVEIVRGDLSRLLYQRTEQGVAYRFGDRITALEPLTDGVRVRFARGAPETFSLVVGADGLHSGVRRLAFGPEPLFLRHHGYCLATYSLPNFLGLAGQALTYTVPGRAISVSSDGSDRARAMLLFAAPARGASGADPHALRAAVLDAYQDVAWEAPRVLAELPRATDLYIDEIATVTVDRYSTGRVVLLGDAAWGGTLGGQGTPLAIVGAYVLAGELAAGGGDIASALARYETHMRPYATSCQTGARRVGSFFAPRTRLGVFLRNVMYRALTSRLLIRQFEKLVKASATSFELPDYPARSSSAVERRPVRDPARTLTSSNIRGAEERP
jgi:2-polyprenyl-6-methoxyphenol hydroxylase-like FAD-dependent oxidoreductase